MTPGRTAAPARVGLVGCGTISQAYLPLLMTHSAVQAVACTDLDSRRAEEFASCSGARVCTLPELLAADDVDVVLNLTVPLAHHVVSAAALTAGKAVYSEKPLGVTRAEGEHLVRLAHDTGVKLGCAPDTFLGDGLQTCRMLVDDGAIGVPVSVRASFLCGGHERWHPAPDFYYQRGGGPLLDMGPYYLTAVVNLLGPVVRAAGSTVRTRAERAPQVGPNAGRAIRVDVATHAAAVLDLASGPVVSLETSFDVTEVRAELLVFGTEGTLRCPDPSTFGGPVLLRRSGEIEWSDVPCRDDRARGIGLVDLTQSIRDRRPPRASGELALHVLDVLEAIQESSDESRSVRVRSTVERPEPLLPPYE